MRSQSLPKLNAEKSLKNLESQLQNIQRTLHPLEKKMDIIQKNIDAKWHRQLLPPVEFASNRTLKKSTSDLNQSLRDRLVWKSHYVAFPRRRFVTSDDPTFIALGTWTDVKSKEFDFQSIRENDAYKYKRFPKLPKDPRPIWK